MNQMKENEMVGQLAHVGVTRYAYKIEVGNLDVKRKIGKMICKLNLYNLTSVVCRGSECVCYLCTLGVPNRKFLDDCFSGKTVFFFNSWDGVSVLPWPPVIGPLPAPRAMHE